MIHTCNFAYNYVYVQFVQELNMHVDLTCYFLNGDLPRCRSDALRVKYPSTAIHCYTNIAIDPNLQHSTDLS